MATQILRLKRTDKTDQHLLLRVSQTSTSKPLDLKLIATEHEHLYHVTLKESGLKSLQSNQFSGDLQEFKNILKYALLHETEGSFPESLQGLETVAAISGKSLTVVFRKNIGGITQRLGAIKLDQDDEREEVSAFDWVDTAVASADSLRTQLQTLQVDIGEQRDQIQNLLKQLDELVKAKKEHEDELLKKFAMLLNAKKLKIRDQQRLLKGAKIDPKAAEALDDSRESRQKPGSSRSGKRKTNQNHDLNDGGNDDDEDDQPQETPPSSEQEETDDEDNIGSGFAPGTVSAKIQSESSQRGGGAQMDIDDPGEVPPRRELPFQRKDKQPAKASQPVEDEEETDDEL